MVSAFRYRMEFIYNAGDGFSLSSLVNFISLENFMSKTSNGICLNDLSLQ
jgi:hypothetical protein